MHTDGYTQTSSNLYTIRLYYETHSIADSKKKLCIHFEYIYLFTTRYSFSFQLDTNQDI